MCRNWDRWSRITSQDIILTVILSVEHFAPHQGSNFGVIVDYSESLTVFVIVIIKVDDIEGGSSLILFTSVISISLYHDSILLEFLMGIHSRESYVFSFEALLSQVLNFTLSEIKVLLSNLLVCNVEVFIESLGFSDVVGRRRIRSENLSRVNILVIVTDSLL